jgi:hypothetical protein
MTASKTLIVIFDPFRQVFFYDVSYPSVATLYQEVFPLQFSRLSVLTKPKIAVKLRALIGQVIVSRLYRMKGVVVWGKYDDAIVFPLLLFHVTPSPRYPATIKLRVPPPEFPNIIPFGFELKI